MQVGQHRDRLERGRRGICLLRCEMVAAGSFWILNAHALRVNRNGYPARRRQQSWVQSIPGRLGAGRMQPRVDRSKRIGRSRPLAR